MAKKDKMVSEPLLISGELNLGPSKAETRRGAGIALMIAGPNNSKIPETWNCLRLKRVLVREGRYSISHISATLAKVSQIECTNVRSKKVRGLHTDS